VISKCLGLQHAMLIHRGEINVINLPRLEFVVVDAVVFHYKEVVLLVAARRLVLHVPVVFTCQYVVVPTHHSHKLKASEQ